MRLISRILSTRPFEFPTPNDARHVANNRYYTLAFVLGPDMKAMVKDRGRVCSDGKRGHLEAYAGRGRLEAEARRRAKRGDKTILFGGDLGRYGRPVLPDPSPIDRFRSPRSPQRASRARLRGG